MFTGKKIIAMLLALTMIFALTVSAMATSIDDLNTDQALRSKCKYCGSTATCWRYFSRKSYMFTDTEDRGNERYGRCVYSVPTRTFCCQDEEHVYGQSITVYGEWFFFGYLE